MQKVQKEYATRREARARQDPPPQCHRPPRNGWEQRRSLQRQILQQCGSEVRHDRQISWGIFTKL